MHSLWFVLALYRVRYGRICINLFSHRKHWTGGLHMWLWSENRVILPSPTPPSSSLSCTVKVRGLSWLLPFPYCFMVLVESLSELQIVMDSALPYLTSNCSSQRIVASMVLWSLQKKSSVSLWNYAGIELVCSMQSGDFHHPPSILPLWGQWLDTAVFNQPYLLCLQ